ncbi:hypothetical protein HDU84_008610 [Entophlyctis sp. JEL0112]|nr:hypothetical protein HDU84_008610 [Entophlyctis sp. JEL0112]
MKQRPQPRPYQLELLEHAESRNIIAFLDTGAGKTLVSILLMEKTLAGSKLIPITREVIESKLSSQLNGASPLDSPPDTNDVEVAGILLPKQPKKVIFLAPTVALVNQQAEKIRCSCDLLVGEYTRDDAASMNRWDELGMTFYKSSTGSYLADDRLVFGAECPSHVALIIFDECHHAWKNHPYSLIMKEFYHTLPATADKPKILGMTASPMFQKSTTVDGARQLLLDLQQVLDCKIITVSDRLMLHGHISQAKECLVEFEVSSTHLFESFRNGNSPEMPPSPSANYFGFYVDELIKLRHSDESFADPVDKALQLVKQLEENLGVWCAGRLAGTLFNNLRLSSEKVGRSHSDVSKKVWALVDIIASRFSRVNSFKAFRAMVFVEKRTTASTLCDLLAQFAPRYFPGLRCSYVTGHGSSSSSAPEKMTNIMQQRALNRFRSGEVNLLVVTRVAEEGIDMFVTDIQCASFNPSILRPACKLIVIFDLFRSNTGYIQSRGRARDTFGSEYLILVKRNDTHALTVIAQAKASEVLTRAIVSALPESSGISNVVLKNDNDNEVVERFVGGEDYYRTRLTTILPSSFDSVLTRYLKKRPTYLPCVEGSVISNSPEWEKYLRAKMRQDEEIGNNVDNVKSNSGIAYMLEIPKDPESGEIVKIFGSVRFTQKSAMQSAGLEAIRYLHITGVLNDHLLPAVKRGKRKKPAFALNRFLLEYKKAVKTEDNVKKITREQYLFDTALGESKNDSFFTTVPKVPDCFGPSEKWIEAIQNTAIENTSDKPTASSDSVEVYFYLVNLGTEFDAYARGCDPPISYTRSLLSENQCDENYYYLFLNGKMPYKEPRRTLAIVTMEPIPATEIPSFPTFLGQNPCPVTLEEHWSSLDGNRKSSLLSRHEFSILKGFQEKFWASVLPKSNRKSEEFLSLKTDEGDGRIYMIAPMVGTVKSLESQNTTNAQVLFDWKMDWPLVNNVVEDQRVPLYDWIVAIRARIGQSRKIPHQQQIHISQPISMGLNLSDPIYTFDEDSNSDSESEDDVELSEESDFQFDNILGMKLKSSRKRKATHDSSAEEICDCWGSLPLVHGVPAFDALFTHLNKFEMPFGGKYRSWSQHDQTSNEFEYLNAICRQILVETPHNRNVYIPKEFAALLTCKSEFTTEKYIGVNTFGEYFETLGYSLTHTDAPLLEVSKISGSRSATRPFMTSDVSPETQIFLPVDVCSILPIPIELFRLSQLLPSIIHRIESFCVIEETKRKLEIPEVSISTLYHAFTASSALESFSYERLETLGDSFLKFACSADLFVECPLMNEGELSRKRGKIVSNRNLCEISRSLDLGGVMIVAPFKAKLWTPPSLFWKSDKCATVVRRFSEKRLADVVEALIGAAYVDGGAKTAWKLLAKFGLIAKVPDNDNTHLITLGEEHAKEIQFTLAEGARIAPLRRFDLRRLESILSYTFRDPNLAKQAFTHQSYSGASISYETLEFLGDAVLDWLIMQHLYFSYPTLSPEKLTDLRQAAVNNESFCRISVACGFHEFLLHSSPALSTQIQAYLTHLVLPGVADLAPIDVPQEGPKALGDLFEATIGAVYLDGGHCLATVWNVLKPLMGGFLRKYVDPAVVEKSPIRQMHEYYQGLGFQPDDVWYRFWESDINGIPCFTCKIYLLDENIAEDCGNSRQLSKRRAAVAGLKWAHDNASRVETLRTRSEVGKVWRDSVRDVQVVPLAANIISAETGVGPIVGNRPAEQEELNVIGNSDLSSNGYAEQPTTGTFRTFLMALEMGELQDTEGQSPAAIQPVAADYFLMQLISLQQHQQQQLQIFHNNQLKQFLGMNQSKFETEK